MLHQPISRSTWTRFDFHLDGANRRQKVNTTVTVNAIASCEKIIFYLASSVCLHMRSNLALLFQNRLLSIS